MVEHGSMEMSGERSGARWSLRAALVLSLATLAVGAVARLSGWEVWDDGLMFARYAENLAHHGVVAWNPGGEPTWGLTSLGHLAWVLVVRALTAPLDADALGYVVAASWLAGVAFLAVAWRLARSRSHLCAAWTCVCLALGMRSLGGHFGTGMDTTLTLVWLLLLAWLADSLWRSPSPRLAAAVASMAGATFFVRPDAVLFPAAVLAALALWGERRWTVPTTVGAAACCGLLWLAAHSYFGTWLPLPYHVKTAGGSHYGTAFAAEYAGLAQAELLLFAGAFWLPLLAVVVDAASGPRTWWRQTGPVDKGLAAASVVFAAYHLTQVAPIMGGSQRFYQPLVPALLWLSWGAVGRLADRMAELRSRRPGRVATAVGAGALLVLLGFAAFGEARRCAETLGRTGWPNLQLDAIWARRASHYWPALDVVSALPAEVVVAATEVGLPGALNPGKVVVDLAGLHDPRFALQGFSADQVFGTHPPDVVYLPHPHYEEMLRQLTGHPDFAAGYRAWSSEQLGSVLGVAVRRGSVAEAPVAAALERVTAARSRP